MCTVSSYDRICKATCTYDGLYDGLCNILAVAPVPHLDNLRLQAVPQQFRPHILLHEDARNAAQPNLGRHGCTTGKQNTCNQQIASEYNHIMRHVMLERKYHRWWNMSSAVLDYGGVSALLCSMVCNITMYTMVNLRVVAHTMTNSTKLHDGINSHKANDGNRH